MKALDGQAAYSNKSITNFPAPNHPRQRAVEAGFPVVLLIAFPIPSPTKPHLQSPPVCVCTHASLPSRHNGLVSDGGDWPAGKVWKQEPLAGAKYIAEAGTKLGASTESRPRRSSPVDTFQQCYGMPQRRFYGHFQTPSAFHSSLAWPGQAKSALLPPAEAREQAEP
ncbi:hypothetical protein ED733_005823 [Metarhizium rileyi]|uniref:Uncharacterized protein n=1 Tax=Metarhizium rileyi (strain RCEF 4871) TaxID=1649241 RepID=A0A5C6GB69_METRR|nr:hypothetical protein ED733_005823 [Metarhizium rileyi]